jgi:hypothetical protein
MGEERFIQKLVSGTNKPFSREDGTAETQRRGE